MQPAAAGLVPIGLAVWNGEANQRDGDKFLSAWHFLHFEHGRVDPRYVNGLLWSPRIKGDPEAGKALMRERGCAACHSYPGNPIPTEAGPGLTWAGGIHRPDYLLESIKNPSTVIVPGKTFSTVTNGTRVSVMPAIKIPERELFHVVEYLRTLR
ncbi:MAG: c-type cytochrome [Candidatus Rokubacteria bacterium]|nr:c-type cytochrome [Candidatus Rokubacteria bacterium]